MTGVPQKSPSFDPRSWVDRPTDRPPSPPPAATVPGVTARTLLALAIGTAILLLGAGLAWHDRGAPVVAAGPPASG